MQHSQPLPRQAAVQQAQPLAQLTLLQVRLLTSGLSPGCGWWQPLLQPLVSAVLFTAWLLGLILNTTSPSPSAAAAGAVEVGSCGSTGDALGAHTQANGKRRASSADVATPAARAAAGGYASGEEGSSDDEVLQLPRKRSRVLGPAGQLLMHLQSDPER